MNHSALILFVKLPRAGAVKTRLGKTIGMKKAAEVYRKFAEHAFQLAEALASHVRVYVFYAPGAEEYEIRKWVDRDFIFVEQVGDGLGDRMEHAFDRTFEDGAVQAIIIGTDVPDLDLETMRAAFSSLATHDVVLGPSTDGGYYLLGMNTPTKNIFHGILWSTNTVFGTTLHRIADKRLSVKLLQPLADIDSEDDLRRFQSRDEHSLSED